MFDIAAPSYVKFGRGSVKDLKAILAHKGVNKPLIVTDAFLASSPLIEKITESLDGYEVYSGVGPDPDLAMVSAGHEIMRKDGHDGLVGFGGGSPMDAAKLINLSLHCGGDLLDWRVPNAPAMPALPLVCIPTTAGTGSEVTRGAVVTNPANQEKVVFMGTACLADVALIDPDLTNDLPLRVAADTGLDALTHALESFVSKKANLYSKHMARLALSLIGNNLQSACLDGDLNAKEAMMQGAAFAGMAFSNSSVAMIHGMSRPLGSFFHIPHGLSNAMLLPLVTQFSKSAAPREYAEASRHCGFASDRDSDQAACEKLVANLQDLCTRLAVPSLAEFGLNREDYLEKIPIMTEQALASGSPANNPRVPSKQEMIELYNEAWADSALLI